jgi:cytochrome c5
MSRLVKVLAALLMGCAINAVAQTTAKSESAEIVKTCSPQVTDECVVRNFKDTLEASEIRGRLVFQNYCTLCHGPEGKGNGRAARLHTPPPFNLTTSTAPRDYIAQVIRKGGEAMGRGKGMPPWGEQLTDEQISDALNFLFSIRTIKN